MQIKDEIKRQERITCSVGVAPNKIIAKIASKFKKPDGLIIIKPEDIQDFIFPLNVSKIPGIGERRQRHLNSWEYPKLKSLDNARN